MTASVNLSGGRPPRRGQLPKNYAFLLELLREREPGTHHSTAEIFAEARRRLPTIGYSTVQRGLRRLASLGLVMEVHLPGSDAALYEPMSEGHAHFACRNCATTLDVPYVTPERVLRRLASALSLTITGEALTFTGLCAACRTSDGHNAYGA
ncbi:MAG TPA: transcriptional repressor [Candidatus Acidoferrales bacterium]|nr:transcriptional repressor [Candidatus Acidoferrales bacterium]